MSNNLILIGAGAMAQEYSKVLVALNKNFSVVGRSEESAAKFENATGIKPFVGGIEKYLSSNPAPEYAIIATGVEMLCQVATVLLQAGCKKILMEKPGALTYDKIKELADLANKQNASVYIAYNRRFYAGVKAAEKLIEEDGGIRSINFEFTEWVHKITPLKHAPGVKEHFALANSTHVIDLAFFFGGFPTELTCYTAGNGVEWHRNASAFSGAGVSDKGVLFSYHADWESAGRWSVEVLTSKRKLIFCPMEKLQQTLRGTVAVEDVPVDYTIDTQYKAGLFAEVDAFINGADQERLCTLDEQVKVFPVYNKIANYQ